MTFDADELLWIVFRQIDGNRFQNRVRAKFKLSGAEIKQLVAGELDADQVAVLPHVDAGHVRDRHALEQRVICANLRLAARLHAGRHRRRAAAKLLVIVLDCRQPIGRIT